MHSKGHVAASNPQTQCDAIAAHRQHPKAVLHRAGRAPTAAKRSRMQLSPRQAQMCSRAHLPDCIARC